MNSDQTSAIDPGLIVVIATFNERETLPRLVEQIWTRLPEASILVVDDNSPDGTGLWVGDLEKSERRISLLHRPQREGLGAATIAGLQAGLDRGALWIATMDADLSHRPSDLGRMWQEVNHEGQTADVVIGSRYVTGGKINNWSLRRKVASRCVNWFARWILWLPTRDNSGALRIYRARSLSSIGLANVDCQGYAYLEQILLHLRRTGARFVEIPIIFDERQGGESKVTFRELLRNLGDILRLAIRRK